MTTEPQEARQPFPLNDRYIHQWLLKCAEYGHLEGLREIIARGADVNFRGSDPDGETPLIRAVTFERLNSVRVLIEAGADVNAPTTLTGWTPLMFALDNPAILHELLAAGADVNARTHRREATCPVSGKRKRAGAETVLHLAAAANNAQAVRSLVQSGSEIEASDESGRAPLDVALQAGGPTEAALALVEAGAKLTPERLELMHAGAHGGDSNLCFFPSVGELDLSHSKIGAVDHPDIPKTTRSDFTCSKCGKLVYSRKALLCGHCGALLSPGLRLCDHQTEIFESGRKWARDLADAFLLTGSKEPCQTQRLPDVASSPGELLRRISCANEFRGRPRPGFWLYVLAGGLVLGPAVFLAVVGPVQIPASLSLFTICIFTIICWWKWQSAAPICPNCRRDVKRCAQSYCHFCGKCMRDRACRECTVRATNLYWVRYCPGCGVWLDTKILRLLSR